MRRPLGLPDRLKNLLREPAEAPCDDEYDHSERNMTSQLIFLRSAFHAGVQTVLKPFKTCWKSLEANISLYSYRPAV